MVKYKNEKTKLKPRNTRNTQKEENIFVYEIKTIFFQSFFRVFRVLRGLINLLTIFFKG